MRRMILALAAVAALVGPAASAWANPSAEYRSVHGRSVYFTAYGARPTHELSGHAPRFNDNRRYRLYAFDGHVGDCAVIESISDDIDTYLWLNYQFPWLAGGQPNPQTVSIAMDDDTGRGSNARIRTELPYTGVYYITTSSDSAKDYGTFELRLRRC